MISKYFKIYNEKVKKNLKNFTILILFFLSQNSYSFFDNELMCSSSIKTVEHFSNEGLKAKKNYLSICKNDY